MSFPRHFMLDIETTGIKARDNDLLQIGILEMSWTWTWEHGGFWVPGREFEIIQHSDRKPESEFAKKRMRKLYELCNKAPRIEVPDVRRAMLDYFRVSGSEPGWKVFFAGKNAANFDVPFLEHHGYLQPSGRELGPDGKDIEVGDYHYRLFDMTGFLTGAQQVLQMTDRSALEKAAFHIYPEIAMPEGRQEHDGVYDCYRQLRVINGLLRLMR